MPHVFLKNAGSGAAINVRGFLWWTGTAEGAASLHPQVIGPGDEAPAQVVFALGADVNWGNAVGYVRYHDLRGTEWQTHYRFRYDGVGDRRVEILTVGSTEALGEPDYTGDKGWVNKPEPVKLWDAAVS